MDEKYTTLEGIIKENGNENMFLIKGDISGIQEFIFNVQSKGASKSLKGKSAYINFLTLIIVHKIIDELKISLKNIIYIGGGNFYLIVPKSFEKTLKDIRLSILKSLNLEFSGDIYLAMDWVEVENGNITTYWKNINDKVRDKGLKKWSELFDDKNKSLDFYKDFFIIGNIAEEKNICPNCHSTFKPKNEKESEEKEVCESCKNFESLGASIRNAKYLKISKFKDENESMYKILDYFITFSKNELQRGDSNDKVYIFNSEEKENNLYFPIYSPVKVDENNKEQPKDFTDLANDSVGAKKLGVLKLDVDNLGTHFENKELKELINTSQMFKKFFEGKLNELALLEEFKDYIYIIYSGGDDTFILGSYDKILLFSQKVKNEFDKFFNDSKYTFSAGILIIDDKQNVKSFSKKVEEYLEKSKDRKDKNGNKVKNGVTIFGETFSWEEYEKLLKLKETIVTIANEDSRAVLSKIMDSTKGFMSAISSDRYKEKSKKIWRLSYYLRNVTNSKVEVEKLIEIYEDLALNRENKYYVNRAIIPLATRLAEFETRREKVDGRE